VKCDLRNAIACLPQFWDQLENRGSKDDKISWEIWKVVEIKVEKIRVVKTKGKREKEQEVRREKNHNKGKIIEIEVKKVIEE